LRYRASAEVIESQVTKPDSIARIDRSAVLTSTSRADEGSIGVKFRRKDDAAAAEVQDLQVRNRHLRRSKKPVIAKVGKRTRFRY
jgi:multidrug efflux pump subunit AcrB